MMRGAGALEVLLAFIIGIVLAAFNVPRGAVAALGIAGILALRYFQGTRGIELFYIATGLLFGFIYFFLYQNAQEAYTKIPNERNAEFMGIVAGEPKATERSLRFSLSLEPPHRGTLTVIVPLNRDIRYGDVLALRGNVADEGGEYVAIFPATEVRERGKGHWLIAHLLALKAHILKGFERSLPPDNAALLGGITLGARSSFSPELREAMVNSGTVHIVAVSGYNIGILTFAIGNAAVYVLARRYAIWLAIALILLFVGMVGTEASVVRAAIMGVVGLLAEKAGRPNDQAYAIALAAAAMLAWDPHIVRTDIGFALSFLSLLGVVYLAPALRSLWRKPADKGFLEWKENVDTTTGAQLAVLPVLFGVFGTASLTSLAANVLILPAVPFTMGIGFGLGLLNSISSFLAFPLARAAELLTSYEIAVMQFFSHYAVPVTNFLAAPLAIAAYYVFLIVFITRRQRRQHMALP
jgi:ComEC/Rec2-related protein